MWRLVSIKPLCRPEKEEMDGGEDGGGWMEDKPTSSTHSLEAIDIGQRGGPSPLHYGTEILCMVM